jgi:hypothetical protein
VVFADAAAVVVAGGSAVAGGSDVFDVPDRGGAEGFSAAAVSQGDELGEPAGEPACGGSPPMIMVPRPLRVGVVNSRRHHREPLVWAMIWSASPAGDRPIPVDLGGLVLIGVEQVLDWHGDLHLDVDVVGGGLAGEPLDQGVGGDLAAGPRGAGGFQRIPLGP